MLPEFHNSSDPIEVFQKIVKLGIIGTHFGSCKTSFQSVQPSLLIIKDAVKTRESIYFSGKFNINSSSGKGIIRNYNKIIQIHFKHFDLFIWCFLVLGKPLLVGFCVVVVWVFLSVFSIFCITSFGDYTCLQHQETTLLSTVFYTVHLSLTIINFINTDTSAWFKHYPGCINQEH